MSIEADLSALVDVFTGDHDNDDHLPRWTRRILERQEDIMGLLEDVTALVTESNEISNETNVGISTLTTLLNDTLAKVTALETATPTDNPAVVSAVAELKTSLDATKVALDAIQPAPVIPVPAPAPAPIPVDPTPVVNPDPAPIQPTPVTPPVSPDPITPQPTPVPPATPTNTPVEAGTFVPGTLVIEVNADGSVPTGATPVDAATLPATTLVVPASTV